MPTPQAACNPANTTAACYTAFIPPGATGQLHYFTSLDPRPDAVRSAPSRALIALHGHPRDATVTFDAAMKAVVRAGDADTLVVAPLFQVAADRAGRCSTPGVPGAGPDDLMWTCSSWLEGATSVQPDGSAGPGAFAVMDALIAELARRWPNLRTVTVAGFSAGAQMVQHAIAFAAPPPAGVRLRYVVADPGTWLYFDPVRPQPRLAGTAADWSVCTADTACSFVFAAPAGDACPTVNRWKYGADRLPAHLRRGHNNTDGVAATADAAANTTVGPDSATALKARYAAAEIHYLAGALDTGSARGTAFAQLDQSCAAMTQGPYRLQRAQAYAAYDREAIAPPTPRPLTVVPGCAHSVRCVFPSPAARAALLGLPR